MYHWHDHTMFVGNEIISVCVEYWNVMFESHFPRGPYYMPVNSSEGYYLSRLSFWKQCQHLFSHVRSCFDAFSCLDFSLSLQKRNIFHSFVILVNSFDWWLHLLVNFDFFVIGFKALCSKFLERYNLFSYFHSLPTFCC